MSAKYQIHVSGLSLLSRCGIAFENRYMLGKRESRSVSMVVGSAVDKSSSADLVSKRDTGELLERDTVETIARDSLVKDWETGDVVVNEEDADLGWRNSRGEATDAAVEMAGFHHANAAPLITPTHVQRAWTLDINGMPIQLAGTIDWQEGSKKIGDTKCKAKSPNRDEAEKSLQLTTYSLAVKVLDQYMPEKVGLDCVVRTPKRHDLKLVQLESVRTEAHLEPLVKRIERAVQVMDSGMFSPADPNSWWCSKTYCSWWGTCPYATRPVSVAMSVKEGI